MSTTTATEKGTDEEALPTMADGEKKDEAGWRTWVLGIMAAVLVLGISSGAAAVNGLSRSDAAQDVKIESGDSRQEAWCESHERRHTADRIEQREDMRELKRKLDEIIARLPIEIK